MSRKVVAWAVVLLLAFLAFTHPATAGQLVHEGLSAVRSAVGNGAQLAKSAKG